jgi:nitric oxide reductase activation protein
MANFTFGSDTVIGEDLKKFLADTDNMIRLVYTKNHNSVEYTASAQKYFSDYPNVNDLAAKYPGFLERKKSIQTLYNEVKHNHSVVEKLREKEQKEKTAEDLQLEKENLERGQSAIYADTQKNIQREKDLQKIKDSENFKKYAIIGAAAIGAILLLK